MPDCGASQRDQTTKSWAQHNFTQRPLYITLHLPVRIHPSWILLTQGYSARRILPINLNSVEPKERTRYPLSQPCHLWGCFKERTLVSRDLEIHPSSGTQQKALGSLPRVDQAEQLLPRSFRTAFYQILSNFCTRLTSHHLSVEWTEQLTCPNFHVDDQRVASILSCVEFVQVG